MYGYWYSPKLDKAFAQKANALLSSDDIQFCLDKRYEHYDWIVEPSKSWENLIRDRCLELRDKYKYLRLWYSGGLDKIYFNRKNPKFYYRSIMSKKYYLKC